MHPPIRTAREVFVAALGLPPERWDAYLDEACAGDEDLGCRVHDLLEAHREAGSFMALTPAGAAATLVEGDREGPQTVIGPYRLLQRIGEGGMGTVWLAQQNEPVQRLVAVKLIKPGMASKQIIARFEAERQALALMDHPNIAKVF